MNFVALGRALRRGWIWVLLILVGALAGGWIATENMTEQYTSQTRMLYALSASGTLQDQLQAANLATQKAATDAQLVVTPTILTPVAEALGDPDVTADDLMKVVTALAQATLLDVSVTMSDPADAAVVAQGIVAQLQARAAAEKIQVNPLDPEAPTYSFVVTPVVPAVEPSEPSSPNVLINMLIAFAVGIVAAAIFLAIRTSADDRVYDADGAATVTDLPVIGTIAPASTKGVTDPATAALRATLLVREPAGGSWLLAPAGTARAGRAGRALASAMAAIGLRTTLLSTVGPSTGKGLTDYLEGLAEPEEIRDDASLAGVTVIPAGTGGTRMADILAMQASREKLDAFTQDSDVVIVAAPPADTAAEAAILARPDVGILVLVRKGSTTKRQLGRAIATLRDVGGDIVGLVWAPRGWGREAAGAAPGYARTAGAPASAGTAAPAVGYGDGWPAGESHGMPLSDEPVSSSVTAEPLHGTAR